MRKKNRQQQRFLVSIAALLVLAALSYFATNDKIADGNPTKQVAQFFTDKEKAGKRHSNAFSDNQDTPNKGLADSVLTENVKQILGNQLKWNGAGAYILNHNKTDLNAKVASIPYAVNETKIIQGRMVPTVANALLAKSTRQYRSRREMTNKETYWRPAGWHQLHGLAGTYNHAVDRGHLLAYSLVGGLKDFDASTSNPKNIATQTAWSNQAGSDSSTGQNYYETMIRKALDSNKRVRYRVTLIYDTNNILASGRQLEAKSSDKSLEFNVFIPNVQPGLTFDYTTGKVQKN
ncbi:DNA/RNA non-specific endonuclease [Streptococcus macacae]|uniref:DNA/RNA non-specific endonuclease-like protein n=1 Tax=Streptococcus macacae NCTC 11558 TaxID=764298 RepID=G5JWI4_9STRE|nr:DNA/RNA non-specific endonuclease [Streptococcus macacae]EHJ52663.1 DNA/RNA non-specific endonuclease-like protein [Streptococcus macacae NCTC 11558]SUN78763.1 membrane nuclease [Streptococcus macacae NCTC 11558]